MSAGTVQVQLAPLARAEALYLLGGVRTGQVVCAERGLTVHRPGFHLLAGADLVVRTPMGTEVDPAPEEGLPPATGLRRRREDRPRHPARARRPTVIDTEMRCPCASR